MNRSLIVDWTEFDKTQVMVDRAGVEAINPHRYEMSLIDGIAFLDEPGKRLVGFADLQPDAFWTRGHFPGRPILPGVLVCEMAAQICAYLCERVDLLGGCKVGLGGLEEVKFRRMVVPGERLWMMVGIERFRRGAMVKIRFQGFVDEEIAAEGFLAGVALPK